MSEQRRAGPDGRARTPAVLSWTIVAATLALEGYVMLHGIPRELPDIVAGRILGTFENAFVIVVGYWLGAAHQGQSRGADAKR